MIFLTFLMNITMAYTLNRTLSQRVVVRIWDDFRCKDDIIDNLKRYITAPESDDDECRVGVTRGTNSTKWQPILTLNMYTKRSSATLRRDIQYCISKESQLDIFLECNISATASMGKLCLADDDCDTENAVCSMREDYGRCVCKEGHRVDGSRRKCIKVNVFLGGQCEKNENCGQMNTRCHNNRCTCADGYFESNGFCTRRNLKLGEACSNDKECGQSQFCHNKICSCCAGYVQIENICVEGRKALRSPCQYHQQCTETPYASLCLGNSSHHLCSCDMGFVERNRSCIRNLKLGEACSNDIECGQSHFCHNKICFCRAGYVQIERICLEGRKALGSPCQYHQQCTETPYASLCLGNSSHHLCSCDLGFVEKNRSCIQNIKLGETCHEETQCGKSQFCINKTCSCQPGFVQIENNCVEGRKSLRSSCQYRQQCTGTPKASLCLGNSSHHWCSCDPGFVEKNRSCIEPMTSKTEQQSSDIIANLTTVKIGQQKETTWPQRYRKKENHEGTLDFGSGISGIVIGATFTAVLFVVYNKRKRQNVHKPNLHQLSDERHINCSDAVYYDPVERSESDHGRREYPERIPLQESVRRESQPSRSCFKQSIYSHLNEEDETDVNIEINYDPVNFSEDAARQPINYDICKTVNISGAQKSFYELQQAFEQKCHDNDV